ncbi:flagellar export chaperone FlgN [Rheinheimera sp. EpRS3]|uniref:flagellar export chaperone FlgN n=1 Tax=Rheinheimera sp. EpRS3 TaxID=1712383 RepID=UPI0007468A13|nr:flagellar export chaperone FlgN [Rheinheimera sp. EpRS3]KUM52378.1 flagellar biosynthesis protein FlgN [Rheinheimera sp. EpRS3]
MTTASNDIIALLDQQEQLLDELLLSLRQEIAALASRDIAVLESIITLKTTQLQQLQQNDALLAACAGIDEQKQQPWFKQKVAALDVKLEECKRQNDINQQTLEQSQLTLARFKTELLASRGKSGLTYTSKGKPAVDSKGKGIKA